jgi:hypothetical protein
VGLDDRAIDRQPDPQVLRLGRVEGVEERLETLGDEPDTPIVHHHEHALGGVDPLADLSWARPPGGATQGVDGVDEQIAQQVWHLEAIAQRPRRIRGQIRLQRYALAVHVAAHQNDHLQERVFTSSHSCRGDGWPSPVNNFRRHPDALPSPMRASPPPSIR